MFVNSLETPKKSIWLTKKKQQIKIRLNASVPTTTIDAAWLRTQPFPLQCH